MAVKSGPNVEVRANRHVSRGTDTLLVALLLIVSGNPAAILVAPGFGDVILTALAIVLGLMLLSKNIHFWNSRTLWIALGFLAILLAQAFDFSFLPIATILGFLTRVFVGAAVVWLVTDFPTAYVKAVVYISAYALVVYAVDQATLQIGFNFRDLFSPLERLIAIDADHRFVLFYSFMMNGAYRNAAFFREPGLYAGYILLALMFLLLRREHFRRSQGVAYGALLMGSLITTFSTAGFVTLPFVLAAGALREHPQATKKAHHTRRASKGIWSVVILVLSAAIVWRAGQGAEFVGEKIIGDLQAVQYQEGGYEITRFGAVGFDMAAIVQRPILGWGLHSATRFADLPQELADLTPSGGVSGFARSFGLLGLSIYAYLVWSSMRRQVGGRAISALFVTFTVLLIAQPNTFLNYPLFLGLMFLGESGAPSLRPRSIRHRLGNIRRRRVENCGLSTDSTFATNQC